MQNETNLALKNNSLFKNANISSVTLKDLNLNKISLSEGEILFKNGDLVTSIFLIVEGEISLMKKHSFSKTTTTILQENDFFGQDEFFTNTERTSTAIALKDTKLVEISKDNLEILLSQYIPIANNLKDTLNNDVDEVSGSLNKILEKAHENKKNKAPIFEIKKDKKEEDLKILNELKKKEANISVLKEKISKYSAFVKKKEKQITDLYNRIEEYKKTNNNLSNMMETQQEQLSRLLNIESDYKNTIEEQKEKIKFLEESVSTLNDENPQLNTLLKEKENELEELKKLVEQLENKERNLNESNNDYSKQLNNSKQEINNLKEKIKELEYSLEVDSKSILKEKDNIIKDLTAKLELYKDIENKYSATEKEYSILETK